MSVRVMAWVFEHSKARAVDRLVLLAIADAANDYGAEAWPSLTTIANKAGVDRRTVTRSISSLIEMGELEKIRKGGMTGRGGVSNSYRVVCPTPVKQGQSAPSGSVPLGAESPEVGAESPSTRGSLPPNPSLPIRTIRGGDGLEQIRGQVRDEPSVTSEARKAARAALKAAVPKVVNPAGEAEPGTSGAGTEAVTG